MARKEDMVTIENTRLIFKNLSGRKSDFNEEGNRNACVVIPPEKLQEILDKGYYVKSYTSSDSQEEPLYYIKVKFKLDSDFPPRVCIKNSKRMIELNVREDPDSIDQIDSSDIERIDIQFTPYDWVKGKNSGRSAYAKSLYVVLHEDPFWAKYDLGDDEED